MVGIRFIVLLVCSIALVESQTLVLNEYYALLNLTTAIGHNFCFSSDCTDCSNWGDVDCSGGSSVLNLRWTGGYFGGTISSYVGLLSQIQSLNLNNNALGGIIPSEIGLLSQLQQLNLQENDLSGKIPSQIGLLSNLDALILSRNHLTGEIPFQIQSIPGLSGSCNVWFGNNLTCDPSYPNPGVTRCMGTANYNDYSGATDAPVCPPLPTSSGSSSSTISSSVVHSTSSVSSTVTWPTRFPDAKIVRVQYRLQGSNANWGAVTVDGTKVSATIPGLLPNTVYEYRLAVINLDGSETVGPTLTFTTPSS